METNEVINLASSAEETSFMWNEDDDDDDDDEEDISNDSSQECDVDIGEENIQDSEDATALDTGESREINKQKIVVVHHKKSQQVRSNSEVAYSLKVMAKTSLKRFKMMAEEDQIREKRCIALRREKTGKNWEHALSIAEIFSRAAQPTSLPNFCFSDFSIDQTSTPTGLYLREPNGKTSKSWWSWSLSAFPSIWNHIECNHCSLCNSKELTFEERDFCGITVIVT